VKLAVRGGRAFGRSIDPEREWQHDERTGEIDRRTNAKAPLESESRQEYPRGYARAGRGAERVDTVQRPDRRCRVVNPVGDGARQQG
jgi:hypothetical protein